MVGLGRQIREFVEGRWLAPGVAVACVAVVVATLLARDLTSGQASQPAQSSASNVQQHASNPLLRFGPNETPAPLAFAPLSTPALSPYRFMWPADYPLVQGMWAGHPLGIDIGVPYGQPVRAVRDGRVIFAGGDVCCNYGLFVIVEHADGWSSLYGHFSRIDVKFGDPVWQGQVLGLSGQTGHADGPHVHFELHLNGAVVDPLAYLEPHRYWAASADMLVEVQHPAEGGPPGAQSAASPGGPAVAAANAPPEAPLAARLDGSTAILLGASWLAHQDDSAYEIEPMSCVAAQSGPNWWVTCIGQLQGCRGQPCLAQLTACVFDQPRLVAAECP
jgi:hypothetical protein